MFFRGSAECLSIMCLIIKITNSCGRTARDLCGIAGRTVTRGCPSSSRNKTVEPVLISMFFDLISGELVNR